MKTKTLSRRWLLCLLLALSLGFAGIGVAYASPAEQSKSNSEEVTRRWANVSSITGSLTFSNGDAVVKVRIMGYPWVTKITTDIVLEREVSPNNWVLEKGWYGLTANSDTFDFSNVWAVRSGFNYRVTLTGYAYEGSIGEWIFWEVVNGN